MKHVPFIAVICLAVFNVICVSAQKPKVSSPKQKVAVHKQKPSATRQVSSAKEQASIARIADSIRRHADSARTSDSLLVDHFIELSTYYLNTNSDSSLYWADTAINFASQKNNWELLNRAYRARRHIMEYQDVQNTKTENILLNTQNELRQQRIILLIALVTVILTMGICLIIFYRRNTIIKRDLERLRIETEEKELQDEHQGKIVEEKNIREIIQETEKKGPQSVLLEIIPEKKNAEEPTPQTAEIALQQEEPEKNNGSTGIDHIKDKLIPMIVHDIRSPLASLENTLSLARENILNPDEFQKLSVSLEAEIYNVRGMLDNMLLWAREQMMEIKINKSEFDLNEMVSAVILMHRNSLIKKNINIHNYLEAGTHVVSDKEMLTAVFRNIFSNAVKFTEPGKNIYIHEIFFQHKIYISIKDEGHGISQDILGKINKKEHISTRGTANEKGTGIGIMFSKDLLDKLGEQFDITSMPGKGTSVTFSIDISNGQNGEAPGFLNAVGQS